MSRHAVACVDATRIESRRTIPVVYPRSAAPQHAPTPAQWSPRVAADSGSRGLVLASRAARFESRMRSPPRPPRAPSPNDLPRLAGQLPAPAQRRRTGGSLAKRKGREPSAEARKVVARADLLGGPEPRHPLGRPPQVPWQDPPGHSKSFGGEAPPKRPPHPARPRPHRAGERASGPAAAPPDRDDRRPPRRTAPRPGTAAEDRRLSRQAKRARAERRSAEGGRQGRPTRGPRTASPAGKTSTGPVAGSTRSLEIVRGGGPAETTPAPGKTAPPSRRRESLRSGSRPPDRGELPHPGSSPTSGSDGFESPTSSARSRRSRPRLWRTSVAVSTCFSPPDVTRSSMGIR